MPRPAIFLDRDGVLCINRDDYVKSWAEFCWLPGALPALVRLAQTPFALVVVTNQAAIERGKLSEATLHEIHARMLAEIHAAGGRLDLIRHCPHCTGFYRKPQPGMLIEAARLLDLDMAASYMIGDSLTDMLAAERAGCRERILVLTGLGTRQAGLPLFEQVHGYRIAADLAAATTLILEAQRVLA